MSAAPTFEPEARAKRLIGRLSAPEPVNALTRATATRVSAGRDDIVENAPGLYVILDRLPAPERERAYRALYFVVRGAADVGSGALAPVIDGMSQRDEAKESELREGRTRKRLIVEGAVRQALATSKSKLPNVIDAKTNEILRGAGKEPVSDRTVRRHRRAIERGQN